MTEAERLKKCICGAIYPWIVNGRDIGCCRHCGRKKPKRLAASALEKAAEEKKGGEA